MRAGKLLGRCLPLDISVGDSVGDIGLALGESGNFLAPKSQKRSCIAARGLGDYKEIGSRKTSSRSFSRGLVVICLCVYR